MDCHQLVPLPNDGPALRASIVATFRDEYSVNWERFLDNMEQWHPKDQKHLEPLSATYKRDALMEAGPSKPLHLEAEDTHWGEKRSAKDTPSEESDEYEDAVEEFKSESKVSQQGSRRSHSQEVVDKKGKGRAVRKEKWAKKEQRD